MGAMLKAFSHQGVSCQSLLKAPPLFWSLGCSTQSAFAEPSPASGPKKPKATKNETVIPPLTSSAYNSKREEYGRQMKKLRKDLYDRLCRQRARDRVDEKEAAIAVQSGRQARKDSIREKKKKGMEERDKMLADLNLAKVDAERCKQCT